MKFVMLLFFSSASLYAAEKPFQVSVNLVNQVTAFKATQPTLRKFYEGYNTKKEWRNSNNCLTPTFDAQGKFHYEFDQTVGNSYDNSWVHVRLEVTRSIFGGSSSYEGRAWVTNAGKTVYAYLGNLIREGIEFLEVVPGNTFDSILRRDPTYDSASVTPIVLIGSCEK